MLLYISTQSVVPTVIVVKTKAALGVQKAAVPDEAGEVAFVTTIPPAVYPVPVTSLVEEYAVVAALTVAVARYSAALIVSGAVEARTTDVPRA